MADDFDDEADDHMIVQNEWSRTESGIRKSGYRQGLSAGEETSLQEGFDAGYSDATVVGFAVGQLQGQISAGLKLLESTASMSGVRRESQPDVAALSSGLMELLEDCVTLQHSIAQKLQSQSQLAMPNIDSVIQPQCDQNQHQSGDSLREITELFGAVGLQALPPIHHAELRQCVVNLQQRYKQLFGTLITPPTHPPPAPFPPFLS